MIKKISKTVSNWIFSVGGKAIYDAFSGKDDSKLLETRKDSANQAVIIFVHGFGGNAEDTWGDFPVFLKDDNQLKSWDIYKLGYNTKLVPDRNGLWASNPNISVLARNLRTQLNHNFRDNYSQIAIVAHSMGGLITQRAILDMIKNVDDMAIIHSVTLYGTPSNGLVKAQIGKKLNNQVRDMASDSEFILSLRKDWDELVGNQPSFKFLTCAGDLDQFVPDSSSLSPFPSNFQRGVNGNHIDIVKPKNNRNISYLVLREVFLDKNDFYKGKYDSAEIAIQLGDFKRVLEKLGPDKNDLRKNQARDFAFALEATGDREGAIQYLETQAQKENASSDIMGTLAGRYKRLYLTYFKDEDLQKAFEFYDKAYNISVQSKDPEQIFYHAINLAFISLEKKDLEASKKYARISLENATKSTQEDIWKYATLGEANLYLGDEANAYYHYMTAVEKSKELWEKDSMQIQWLSIVQQLGMEKIKERLIKLFNESN